MTWEPRRRNGATNRRLLAALLLARVDGKSPVEYLDAADRELVRQVVARLIARAGRIARRGRARLGSAPGILRWAATAIRRVRGRRVWDSRGRPTVEAEVELESGAIGRAIAPAGASTGSGEAVDLRDDDGFDVRRAVANVNGSIAQALAGADAADQEAVDRLCSRPTAHRTSGGSAATP